MSGAAWLQFAVMIVLLGLTVPVLGSYMAKVFGGGRAPGDRFFGPIERFVYRLGGIDPDREQKWTIYGFAVLAFSLVSVLFLYVLQRVQEHLPFNPTHVKGVPSLLAMNTAVSFLTNTNWQNYSGESTMSHLTQMAGLAVQNFVSAAVGLAIVVALIRGLTRHRAGTIGNFWVDLTKATVRILLPLAFVFALVFVSQGAIQNLDGNTTVKTVEQKTQTIPGGPFASQEAIKEIGTNGGGTLNANSAHPFENPNGFTDFLQIYLLLAIPFSLAWTFGVLAKNKKQGIAVLSAMAILWLAASVGAMALETGGNSALDAVKVNQQTTSSQPGGNFEGKETRFGSASCGLFAASTTGTSTGAVNCAHDSLTPLAGGIVLSNMMLGEVSPGGVGSGLYGMLIFALLSVFIAGLMVGRTPEYLGKKIQAAEMKLVVIYLLAVPLVVLAFAGASVVMKTPQASILNPGAHGLSEVVYGFTSTANNNGSAFGGLSGNTDWYNTTFAICMIVGRFVLMIAVLAIAGSLARKQTVPESSGTFPTDTPLFAGLLTAVVVVVVGLTYLPVLALGPIVEHLGI
ncbi:MAG: potassium-transporting ATPase subunit KdpA [Acidimicrobiia bacterium]